MSPKKMSSDVKRNSYGSLRMGTGGVMSIYDNNKNSKDTNNIGPPKPPRIMETDGCVEGKSSNTVGNIVSKMEALTTYSSNYPNNNPTTNKIYDQMRKSRPTSLYATVNKVKSNGGSPRSSLPLSIPGYSLQRSQTHSHIVTSSSLERNGRSNHQNNGNKSVRPRRGGSLERLLDGPSNHQPLQPFTAPHHHNHHTTIAAQQQPHGANHSRESSNSGSQRNIGYHSRENSGSDVSSYNIYGTAKRPSHQSEAQLSPPYMQNTNLPPSQVSSLRLLIHKRFMTDLCRLK